MQDKEYYRRRLLAEKELLEGQIRMLEEGLNVSLGESVAELSRYDNHPADLGSETFERGKDVGLKDNSRLLLGKVEDALQRLEAGTYGRCKNCGRQIPPERLEAIPYATLCYACKEAQEERHRHPTPRPLEEETLKFPFGRTFRDESETIGFDGEDSWQAVARFNRFPNVFYEDIGEVEDKIGQVEKTDNLSNEDYQEQL